MKNVPLLCKLLHVECDSVTYDFYVPVVQCAIFYVPLFCILGDSFTEATGDFIVLQSPEYVHFLPDASPIAVDEIVPIIAASFGLPFQKVILDSIYSAGVYLV